MLNKQTRGIKKASQKKKQLALEKTDEAIAQLAKSNQKITIRSVAKKAGVSVSYIYKYPELAYKIQRLREQQKYSLEKYDYFDNAATKQLTILQQEKAELTRKIEELKAITSEVKTGRNSLEDLQADNIKLRSENQRLTKELKYTQKKLQEARNFILNREVE